MTIGKTGQYAIIGITAMVAIILIVWFVMKANDKKKKEKESEDQQENEQNQEDIKTANFGGLSNQINQVLKLGSIGKEVEQLQYFLAKKYNEIYRGERISFDNIGFFDKKTEEILSKLTEKKEMDEKVFKTLRINSFKTYRYV